MGYTWGISRCCCSSFVTHRVLDVDGNVLLNMDHGANLQEIMADASGNIYVVGNANSDGDTVQKFNSSGTSQWAFTHETLGTGIDVDSSGNVYVSGLRIARKLNSSGVEQWSYDHTANIFDINVDSATGDVFICGFQSSSGTAATNRKLNSSGVVQNNYNHGAGVSGSFHNGTNYYATGSPSSTINTRVFNSSLSPVTSFSVVNAGTNGIWVDNSGNITLGSTTLSSKNVYKFNSGGTLQWSAYAGGSNSTTAVNGTAVDSSGNVYAVVHRNSSIGGTSASLRKFDSSGTLVWSYDHGGDLIGAYVDSSDNVYVCGERVST